MVVEEICVSKKLVEEDRAKGWSCVCCILDPHLAAAIRGDLVTDAGCGVGKEGIESRVC